jgi:hypothetical protein
VLFNSLHLYSSSLSKIQIKNAKLRNEKEGHAFTEEHEKGCLAQIAAELPNPTNLDERGNLAGFSARRQSGTVTGRTARRRSPTGPLMRL